MVKSLLNIPINKDSINFKESHDPHIKLVKRLTSKNRRNLKQVIDSGADFPTVQKAERELDVAINKAQLQIATSNIDDIRKAQKFHNIVVSVEGRRRDKSNERIRKLKSQGLTDVNRKTQLVFAERSVVDASQIIKESQTKLDSLENKLSESVARQKQFTVRKGTFSP